MVIQAMEKHLHDTLRSHGISTVTVKAVRKAGKPTMEFFGPEEDVKKAREYLGVRPSKCGFLGRWWRFLRWCRSIAE
jgi:hypothetical protein